MLPRRRFKPADTKNQRPDWDLHPKRGARDSAVANRVTLTARRLVAVAVVIAVVRRLENAEQSMCLTVRSAGEVKVGGNTRSAARAESQRPQAIDRDRTPGRTLEQAAETPMRVKGHDRAAAKIPNE